MRTCPENYTQHIGSCAVLMPAASSVGAAQQQWYDVSILEVARIARVRTNERTDKGTFTFDQKLRTRHATLFGLMVSRVVI